MHTVETVQAEMPLLFQAGWPRAVGEPMKAWWSRIARSAGLTGSYVKRLHYQEVQVIPAHVADGLRAAAEQARSARDRAQALKVENDMLMAAARRGVRIDWFATAAKPHADVCEPQDERQMMLPFRGFR